MKSVLKVLAFVCILNISFPLFSYKSREEFPDPWKYLRQEFVTKVDDYCHSYLCEVLNIIGQVGGAALGCLISNECLHQFLLHLSNKHKKQLEGTKPPTSEETKPSTSEEIKISRKVLYLLSFTTSTQILGPMLGVYLGNISFEAFSKILKKFLQEKASYNALKQFLDEWDDNKKILPKELQECFSLLYKHYQNNGTQFLKTHSLSSVNHIRRILSLHLLDPNLSYKTEYELPQKKRKQFIFEADLRWLKSRESFYMSLNPEK